MGAGEGSGVVGTGVGTDVGRGVGLAVGRGAGAIVGSGVGSGVPGVGVGVGLGVGAGTGLAVRWPCATTTLMVVRSAIALTVASTSTVGLPPLPDHFDDMNSTSREPSLT